MPVISVSQTQVISKALLSTAVAQQREKRAVVAASNQALPTRPVQLAMTAVAHVARSKKTRVTALLR